MLYQDALIVNQENSSFYEMDITYKIDILHE